jgi:hypothetical protein
MTATELKPNTPYWFRRQMQNGKYVEAEPVEITVGMECTYHVGSDRYPYEVVEIRDAKTLILRAMSHMALKTVEYGDTPPYLYTPNPEGRIEYARLVVIRGRRYWVSARPGDGPRSWRTSRDGDGYSFAGANYYQDPHF